MLRYDYDVEKHLRHTDEIRDAMKQDHLVDSVLNDLVEQRNDQHGVYIPVLACIGQRMLHIAIRLIKLYGDDDPSRHPHWTQNRSTQ